MNGERDHAGAAAERVRERLAPTGAARRDAVRKARESLNDATEDADEITGRVVALASDALAVAKQAQRARAITASLPPVVRKAARAGHIAKALGGALLGFVALAKALGWF